MKKFNLFGNLGKRTRRLYGVLFLFAIMSLSTTTHAQCNLNAEDSYSAYVDDNCQAEVSMQALLIDDGAACDTNHANYTITVYSDANGLNIIDQGVGVPAVIPSGYVGQTVYGKIKHDTPQQNETGLIPIPVFDTRPPTISCYGQTSTMTGTLVAGDPTYTRSSSNNPSTSVNCDTTGVAGIHYDVYEFTIDQADNYTFALDGSAAADAQFFVALYENNFDPANVCDNFLYDDYATALGGNVSIPNINLTNVNGKYFLVTTTVGAGQTGDYTWTFSSAAGGKVFGKGATCDYNVFCHENIEDKVKVIGFDNCDNPTQINLIHNDVDNNYPTKCTNPDGKVIEVQHRVYQAVDESGNASDELPVNISIIRMRPAVFNSNAIQFPENKTVADDNSLTCAADSWEDDLNYPGHPSPNVTGWPTITLDGVTTVLDLNSDFGCNFSIEYTDMVVSEDNCLTRIQRMWTIRSPFCDNPDRKRMHFQIIEIADTTAPAITCSGDVTVNTNQFDCFDSYAFPVPTVNDNCQADDWTWAVDVINSSTGEWYVKNAQEEHPFVRDIPLGVNHVTYTVTDACGNKADCKFDVTVEDKIEPVAVCQTMTTISLTYDGEAQLPAYAVNSGSYDNCSTGSLDFKIKRMEQTTAPFTDFVTFDCSDIAGNNWMVVLQVKDAAGNIGTCMVSVEVQDKLAPSITCPANQEVECDHIYEPDSLTKYFGWPTAHDNCNFVITTDSTEVENECYSNPVRTITRHFTATDDGGRTDECTQTINFVRTNYFGYSKGSTNSTGYGAITWPEDQTYTSCMDPGTASDPTSPLHPNTTGWPILDEASCDLVSGNNYEDQVYIDNDNNPSNNSSCFKIIRTWTVLDNCHKVDGKFVTWTYDQVIFVNNSVEPTIEATPDKSVCTYDETCTDGHIDLQYTCHDDCTTDANMKWRYYIDYNNDNAVGMWDDSSSIHNGNQLDASGDYAIGTHKILWQVWDQCGNSTVQEQLVTIVNCKKPTPICIANHVELSNMAGGPAAMMSADMFNNGSNHTCGYRLIFSFSADTSNKVKTYFCNDKGIQPVQMWVTAVLPDGSIVSQDYCETTCDVQDNNELCPDPIAYGTVSGAVLTDDDKKVEGVKINLLHSEFAPAATDKDGQFAFENVENNRNYIVEPSFKNDYLNGLSTLDIVILQKHLLGIKKIKSPYDLIAADANNDKKLSASDILLLRKLILGSKSEIKNNTAWRFIAKDFKFSNEKRAMAEDFPSSFKINNMTNDQIVDFIAVKVGDLSGDAKVNDEVEGRSEETISFVIDDARFNTNDMVEIPVYSKDITDIQGFQTTISFDVNKLEFEGIKSGLFNIDEHNYAMNRLDRGYLPVSWDNSEELSPKNNQVLFTLRFKAIGSSTTNQVLSFNSDITKSEAYNSAYDVFNVELDYRSGGKNDFVLMQNTPNPFSNSTVIKFSNPNESTYELNVFDLTGKLVYKTFGHAQKGLNSITIDKSKLNVSGVLYYTVSTDVNTATKKMVVLK